MYDIGVVVGCKAMAGRCRRGEVVVEGGGEIERKVAINATVGGSFSGVGTAEPGLLDEFGL